MTDAEATIKFAIFDALSFNWKKDSEVLRDEVFKSIFAPDVRWAIEELLSPHPSKEGETK